MFVPGTGGDFGGEETSERTRHETEGRQKGAASLQEAVSNGGDLDSSQGNNILETPGITDSFHQTSHAGKDRDCPESLPTVVPIIAHIDMVNFEAQIQEIDMGINKFDKHTTGTANPGFMDELSPRMSTFLDQEKASDKSTLLSHVAAHDCTNEPSDSEGNQLGLRTWKRLARLKQNSEEYMLAPTLGKHALVVEGEDETEQVCKKIQISKGDCDLLAETAKQSRQYQ